MVIEFAEITTSETIKNAESLPWNDTRQAKCRIERRSRIQSEKLYHNDTAFVKWKINKNLHKNKFTKNNKFVQFFYWQTIKNMLLLNQKKGKESRTG